MGDDVDVDVDEGEERGEPVDAEDAGVLLLEDEVEVDELDEIVEGGEVGDVEADVDVDEVEVRWAIFVLSMCSAGSLRIVLKFGVW